MYCHPAGRKWENKQETQGQKPFLGSRTLPRLVSHRELWLVGLEHEGMHSKETRGDREVLLVVCLLSPWSMVL
jgi:hypothetical protein